MDRRPAKLKIVSPFSSCVSVLSAKDQLVHDDDGIDKYQRHCFPVSAAAHAVPLLGSSAAAFSPLGLFCFCLLLRTRKKRGGSDVLRIIVRILAIRLMILALMLASGPAPNAGSCEAGDRLTAAAAVISV